MFGFLFTYLYTQLIVARLIAATDSVLGATNAMARNTLQGMAAWRESLVPRIGRSRRVPDLSPAPTPAEVRAALAFQPIPFEELISDPDVTLDELWAWSRAKAVLNDYRAAARGYVQLLGAMEQ